MLKRALLKDKDIANVKVNEFNQILNNFAKSYKTLRGNIQKFRPEKNEG